MTDLNELLVFTRVVQAGSFTDAARILGMPKSSVSKKVADLEERLGVRLLQRTTRKLGLTDAGRVYFQRGARIVADLEEAEQAVAELEALPRGLLRATAPLAFGWLAPIISSFLKRCPEVQLELACTDRVVDLVHDGFDVAIRASALQDSTLIARKLGAIKRVLVASPAYLKKQGTPREPGELTAHACISFGGGVSPNLWALVRGETKIEVQVTPRLSVNDFDILLHAARAGAGIAWVPDFLVAEDLSARRLKAVLPAWCSAEAAVHAVYPSARHLSPKVVAFVEALRSGFKS